MTRRYFEREDGVDAIKLHSTKQGRRIIVNLKKSNKNKVTFKCAAQSFPCKCKFHAVLRKSKRKDIEMPWALSQLTKLEDLQHDDTCTSRAKISFREVRLIYKSSESRVLPRIKDTAKRIASAAKITEASVSPNIAAKVRLAEAHQVNNDYVVNWKKLDTWAAEMEAKNPGSHTHVDAGSVNSRFKSMFVGLGTAGRVVKHTGQVTRVTGYTDPTR